MQYTGFGPVEGLGLSGGGGGGARFADPAASEAAPPEEYGGGAATVRAGPVLLVREMGGVKREPEVLDVREAMEGRARRGEVEE